MNFDLFASQLSKNKTSSVPSGSGSLLSSSGQNSGGKSDVSSLFLSKLNQILAKNGLKQNGGVAAENTNNLTTIDTNPSQLLKDINSAQGVEFLTKLKQYLMASGHNDLKGVSLGDDGLDAVKSMLSKAGFSQSKVADLIKTLKSESDNGNVLVSDLMDGLLSLDPEDISTVDSSTDMDAFFLKKQTDKKDDNSELNNNESGLLLDVSAIPFVSSIMKSLGIPDDVINSIVANSEVKGEGIGVNTLIADLQELQKTSFFTGNTFQNSSDIDSIKGMFRQLGLPADKNGINGNNNGNNNSNNNNNNGNEKIALNDLVSALEGLRANNTSKDGDSKILADLPEELSINGLNQSRKNPFSLMSSLDNQAMSSLDNQAMSSLDNQAMSSLDSKGILPFDNKALVKNQVESGNPESDTLLQKLMGDLHSNNDASKKAAEEKQLTESEIKYNTLKNTNHQLLMNLSGIQQDADADKFSITSNEIFQNIIKNASNSSKSTATSFSTSTSPESRPASKLSTSSWDSISLIILTYSNIKPVK
ncbi:MAG: hypothetical protein HQK67_07095 [Desulfamplus sp.]|nr:hypothetical protein [Desulfamplus sp.]